MTDLQRSENAAIILSHSQIKKEFVQHSGRTIADLVEMVERISPEPEYMPGLCPRCFNYREIAINMPDGDYQIMDCLECAL